MAQNKGGKVIQMLSPENYIRKKVRSLPIYECLVNEDWEDTQMVQLSVARQHTNGNVTVCFYLVDLMCLGVKDTHYLFNIPLAEYRAQLEQMNEKMPVIPISYELTHNIVFAGIEFADEYGFKPHKNFTSITRFMLKEDTEDIELIEIECGMDGKPTYIRSPFDDNSKVQRIIAQLEKTAGPDNYIFMDEDDFEDDQYDDNDFEEDFDGMTFDEKKELFLDLSKQIEKETDEEDGRFVPLVNSLIDDLIDIDQHNKYFDELYLELNIKTDDNDIPNQLLGISPVDQPITDYLKDRFIDIYHLNNENTKQAARELKLFEKESNGLPGAYLLELLNLEMEESRIYPKRLKEYALKYPDYSLIRILWVTELVTSGKDLQKIPEYPFKFETFFPDRTTIHPIERFKFFLLHAFVAAMENDLNKIEAFGSILGEFDFTETEEEVLDTIISMFKVNYLLTHLTAISR